MIRYSSDGYWVLIGREWVRLSDGKRIPVIQGGGKAVTVQNNTWAFGDDDGSESGHSLDTENADRTAQVADVTFLIRIQVEETGGGDEVAGYALFAAKNDAGGTFTEVTTGRTDGIRIANDTQSRTDDENTTERLTAGAGTFTAGKYDDGQTQQGTTTVTLNTNYTDLEFAIEIDSANASNGNWWDFRVEFSDGTDLDNYGGGSPDYPRVTASIVSSNNVSESDSVTVGDTASAVTSAPIASASDTVTVGDTPTMQMDLSISVSDGVSVSDSPVVGRIYYIDATTGSDSDDGLSPADAWQTIAKVNGETFNPGDQILFKRGEIWRETLTPPSDGTASADITFDAYGSGDKPVLNGSDVMTTWTAYSGNTWQKTGVTTEPLQVLMDDIRLTEGADRDSLNDHEWVWASDVLYVRDETGDPDGSGVEIEAGQRDKATTMTGRSYLRFENLRFCKANQDGFHFFNNASVPKGIEVLDCEIDTNRRENVHISGIDGILFRGCEVHNCQDEHGFYLNASQNPTDNITIEQCNIYNNDDHGIQLNPNAGYNITGLIVRRNKIYDNGGKAVVDMCSTGAQYYNNLIYDNNAGATGEQEQVFLTRNDPIEQTNATLYHNTIITPDNANVTALRLNPTSTGNTIKNNIFYARGSFDKILWALTGSSATLDNNDYYASDFTGAWNWQGTGYDTLATYVSAASQDANAIDDDPAFVSAASDVFNLQSTSDAIGAGATGTGVTDDYNGESRGSPPDIGALEYQPALIVSDSVTVGDSPTVVVAGGVVDPDVSESDAVTVGDTASLDPLVIPDLGESDAVTVGDAASLTLALAGVIEADSVTVTDTASLQSDDPNISESDSITVTDSLPGRYYDNIIVTDTLVDIQVTGVVASYDVSESDTVTVADSATVETSDPDISESDSVTVTDTAVVDSEDLNIAESESVTVADAANVVRAVVGELNISESDGITVADSAAFDLPIPGIVESDAVTVADSSTLYIGLYITESDSVTIADAATVDGLLLNISESDNVSVTDSPTVVRQVEGELNITEADGVTVGDTASLDALLLGLSESDSITVADAASIGALQIDITETDGVTVADSPTVFVTVTGALTITASDAVTLSENVTTLGSDPQVAEADSVTVADAAITRLGIYISESDSVTVADATGLNIGDLDIAEVDTATIADTAIVLIESPFEVTVDTDIYILQQYSGDIYVTQQDEDDIYITQTDDDEVFL